MSGEHHRKPARRGGRITYANAMATIAVFIALGGVSHARDAVVSVRAMISGKQIAPNSITSRQIKDGSLGAKDFKPGLLAKKRGGTGTQGPRGPQGLPGTFAGDAVTSAMIADGAIVSADLAAALKDGPAGEPTLRSLGTGANQAAAGNDPRFSDARVPTGTAGGDLTGTYPNPTIKAGTVTSSKLAPIDSWTTASLGNNWTNYDTTGYHPASYYKDHFGLVHLRGAIKSGMMNADGGAFALPAGYRPSKTLVFLAFASGIGGPAGRLDITSAGEVKPVSGGTDLVSLEGITFRADQ